MREILGLLPRRYSTSRIYDSNTLLKLALVVLFFSESFVAQTLCKVLTFCVLFGAVNAIFLLPLLLSVTGA